ncbi:MAG: 4-hydroxy-tetrahydrodipicolinate reductase [Nanoarchaeota archaeon]|nr:4-hydroxy-tetrahydrodipicolinate reductase [Nanoarchaeota archaeon]
MMKIAIVGYGRMGKEVEAIAKSKEHEVVTIDPNCRADFPEINEESMKNVDAAIDFTIPETALKNAKLYNQLKINTVMATTGWYDKMEEMKSNVSDIGFIWAGNFSIGVNVLFRILDCASKIINNIDSYDISAFEMHHKGKKDSPSGTAKMLADIILKNVDRKKKLATEKLNREIAEDELHFASMRGGSIPGTHKIIFDSEADTIEITHTARNRSGFAVGSVMAAEWIKGKKGFYNIDDLMNEIIGGQ